MRKIKCMHCKKMQEVKESELTEGHKNGSVGFVCDDCNAPDWKGKCEVCGASPIVPMTGLCGPCTFGEAETANGNW